MNEGVAQPFVQAGAREPVYNRVNTKRMEAGPLEPHWRHMLAGEGFRLRISRLER